jgi:Sigma-70, region 4
MWVVVENVRSIPVTGNDGYSGIGRVERRALLSYTYETLPAYPSSAFWDALADVALPLEVLVRLTRNAVSGGDIAGRNRLLALIIERMQSSNEAWARRVLASVVGYVGAEKIMLDDLCADLAECLMRAIVDHSRHFWEENFQHCLYFERKHVYRSFMMREGRWHDPLVKRSERIPHSLLASLDQPTSHGGRDRHPLDVEDERCQLMLRAIEHYDVLEAVQRLPDYLKAVVLLLFWEGRTEKDAARILNVTDRTVRNRMREALKRLRVTLHDEKGSLHE